MKRFTAIMIALVLCCTMLLSFTASAAEAGDATFTPDAFDGSEGWIASFAVAYPTAGTEAAPVSLIQVSEDGTTWLDAFSASIRYNPATQKYTFEWQLNNQYATGTSAWSKKVTSEYTATGDNTNVAYVYITHEAGVNGIGIKVLVAGQVACEVTLNDNLDLTQENDGTTLVSVADAFDKQIKINFGEAEGVVYSGGSVAKGYNALGYANIGATSTTEGFYYSAVYVSSPLDAAKHDNSIAMWINGGAHHKIFCRLKFDYETDNVVLWMQTLNPGNVIEWSQDVRAAEGSGDGHHIYFIELIKEVGKKGMTMKVSSGEKEIFSYEIADGNTIFAPNMVNGIREYGDMFETTSGDVSCMLEANLHGYLFPGTSTMVWGSSFTIPEPTVEPTEPETTAPDASEPETTEPEAPSATAPATQPGNQGGTAQPNNSWIAVVAIVVVVAAGVVLVIVLKKKNSKT